MYDAVLCPFGALVGREISVSVEFEKRGNTSVIYFSKIKLWMMLYYAPLGAFGG